MDVWKKHFYLVFRCSIIIYIVCTWLSWLLWIIIIVCLLLWTIPQTRYTGEKSAWWLARYLASIPGRMQSTRGSVGGVTSWAEPTLHAHVRVQGWLWLRPTVVPHTPLISPSYTPHTPSQRHSTRVCTVLDATKMKLVSLFAFSLLVLCQGKPFQLQWTLLKASVNTQPLDPPVITNCSKPMYANTALHCINIMHHSS